MPVHHHTSVASVSEALDLICGYAIDEGSWTLPYDGAFITANSIDPAIGTYDELEQAPDGTPVTAVDAPDRALYRRAHLVKGDVQINLACGFRGSASMDFDIARETLDGGGLVEISSVNSETNTPIPLWEDRYDADKDGVTPAGYHYQDHPDNGGWSGFMRQPADNPDFTPASWLAVSATAGSATFDPVQLWYKQAGANPHYNGDADRVAAKCCIFKQTAVSPNLITDTGPEIADLWVVVDPETGAVFAGFRQNVTVSGAVKTFFQFMYFGTSYNNPSSAVTTQGFFNASFSVHAPFLGFNVGDIYFDIHDTTGSVDGLPLGVMSNFNDTSHTYFLCEEEDTQAPYNASNTGGWGCGGGSICTGPFTRQGAKSIAHRTPSDRYVEVFTSESATSPEQVNAVGPVQASFDPVRRYVKLQPVYLYRAIYEGVNPNDDISGWEGVADRGGVIVAGRLPNILLSSSAAFKTLTTPETVSIDGGQYLLFPFFTVDLTRSGEVGSFTPRLTSAYSEDWANLSFTHKNCCMAVRVEAVTDPGGGGWSPP